MSQFSFQLKQKKLWSTSYHLHQAKKQKSFVDNYKICLQRILSVWVLSSFYSKEKEKCSDWIFFITILQKEKYRE